MPTSKCDFKMMTDNELFNGMPPLWDDKDGLNEMNLPAFSVPLS